MGTIRYKIWHDLWVNKSRTLLVVVVIAIGAFAVGAILGGRQFITQDLTRTWTASNPATIGLEVEPAVGDAVIQMLESLPEVEHVEGWLQEKIQWRRSPADPWEQATLMAVDEYGEQDIRKIGLDEGAWPYRKSMGVQRIPLGLEVGDTVYLQIEDNEYQVDLNGQLYNPAIPPGRIDPKPTFYATRERFAELTGDRNYSLIVATVPHYTEALALVAANRLQADLEKLEVEVSPALPVPGGFRSRVGHPDRFVAQDMIDSVFMILTVMAVMSLLLGMVLVFNTINAIVSQQINQIGIMKAIGANFRQILQIYFSLIFAYALLALGVAVPLGALGAHFLRLRMIRMISMEPGSFEISLTAVLVQVVVAVFFPVIVSIMPVFKGASITVREAVSDYGLGGQTGLLERLLSTLEWLPRIATLTINNTFQNKLRVTLTEVSLIGAGVIFLMVMHTQATLTYTYREVVFSILQANVMLDLSDETRFDKITDLTATYPGVKVVEIWGTSRATIRPVGQPESNDDPKANLTGLPLPTAIYQPKLRVGRWLHPDDQYTIVVNQALATEAGLQIGDRLLLDIPLQQTQEWEVVGILFDPLDPEVIYLPRDILLVEIGQVDRGKAVRIQTEESTEAAEAMVADGLRELYEARGMDLVASTQDTAHRLTDQKLKRVALLFTILTSMAMLIAVVGGVALSGGLSISVLERTREIGIMRSIGALSWMIIGQFIGEGLILGWLSWLVAIPLSIPAGQLLIYQLSQLLRTELVFQFSFSGLFYWLLTITALSIIASWFPAQRASQTSVRESLAYA